MSDNPLLKYGFAHEQTEHTATYFVKNRFKKRQRARRVTEPVPIIPTVDQIADAENLIETFYKLRSRKGQAPGPDGFTYTDWSRREAAEIMRDLSRDVRSGVYRPGSTRKVKIPKMRGGYRTLSLGNIADRVLAAALNKALTPFWETKFLPMSMGFRPRRSVWQLLAELEHSIITYNRWVLAIDDIKNAFPNVLIDDVMADHRRYINDPALLSLIGVVLRGSVGQRRIRGIDQGNAYSPTALNVRLHHALDLGMAKGHHPHWRRYADNLVGACRCVSEGFRFLENARQLLEMAGFALKNEDGGPQDLRKGAKIQLLGLTISRQDGVLIYTLGVNAWTKLAQNLERAHKTSDPALSARQVVDGWVEANGPTFENCRERTLRRILMTAAQHGFREVHTVQQLAYACKLAFNRWDVFRKRIFHDLESRVQIAQYDD
jgi:hypothetical protein